MKQLAEAALEEINREGIEYGDIRIVEKRISSISVRDDSVKSLSESENAGYGIRVLYDGAWGFASGTVMEKEKVAKTTRRAIEVARASGKVPSEPAVEMVKAQPASATRAGPCAEDPFEVPVEQQAELLLSACDRMLGVENIVKTSGSLRFERRRRFIANTDGSYLDLTNYFTLPGLQATAVVGDESQTRSYQGGGRQAGYEYVREIDFEGKAKRWAEEAVLKAKADPSPEGVMDLVLDPDNLGLTMHESVGHPTESDRILGWEANMAGKSFVELSDVGSLPYGSELVNFTVNNQLEGGVGSWFYDDDGVRMQKFPLIKDGILVDLSVTRETAPLLGRDSSNGCCRASGFSNFPINRIPNLYLEPGPDEETSPEDLIADIERGIYIEGRGSFSIDQMRRNFQFGGDMFWLIENGRRVQPLKKVTYQAQTTDFWGSCDAMAGVKYWRPHGIMSCGKGEPSQRMYMTHGASHCRFRDITVGAAKK
ncbi:MAG: TldD/PmbA family protein [Candidatus Brocadiia bacterium]